MSKTIRFHQLGGPEVLKLEDTPLQQPGKGEVRLQAQAVGLNRAEYMFMHGQYLESTDLPARIGYEAAGVVDAVGPDVDPGWVGRKVSTLPAFSMNHYGALAEQPIVPAYAIAEYPDTLSAVDGAAIWMQYLTVYSSLVAIGQLTKGDFVLITAASSSVGIAAIQTVRAEGAVSIATTRTGKKKDQLFGLGADHVIATEEEDVAARVHEITGDIAGSMRPGPVARHWNHRRHRPTVACVLGAGAALKLHCKNRLSTAHPV